jgi:AraC-like DNA-binding protein
MDPRISGVLKLIARKFAEPLTIAQLASAARLSSSRLAHLFHAEVGVPPARFLQIVRLTSARTLLETTRLSVRDAMEGVGFHDPSHFARDFRRHHGMSPRDCRGASLRALNSKRPGCRRRADRCSVLMPSPPASRARTAPATRGRPRSASDEVLVSPNDSRPQRRLAGQGGAVDPPRAIECRHSDGHGEPL